MYDSDIDTYNVLCLFLPASSPTPTFPKKEDQSKGDLIGGLSIFPTLRARRMKN